jgi:endonuclease G
MSLANQPRGIFSEPDQRRLRARLRAVAPHELGARGADRLLSGDISALSELSGPTKQAVSSLIAPRAAVGGQLELMVGATLDYVGIAFLERASNAAVAVVRVTDLAMNPIGTGVMVSPRLLLTNHHVCATAAQAAGQLVQFRYELDVDGQKRPTTEFRLAPEVLFVTSDVDELDFTLVAIGPRQGGTHEAADFGHASLSAAPDKHAVGDFVTLIQHPAGEYKQIALRENRVLGRGQGGITLHYTADTLGGSSGSPIFNDQFQLIGLHHSGGPHNDLTLEDGSPVPAQSNEGIRVSAIVRYVREVADTLTGTTRRILVDSLDAPAALPARLDESVTIVTTPAVPVNEALPVVTPPSSPLAQVTIASYASRPGYSPTFLGPPVPLPRLSPALWASAAVPTAPVGTDGVELRYACFSTIQHATGRLPLLTAANLDGSSLASAAHDEPWRRDPRVRAVEQLDADCFTAEGAIRSQPLVAPLGAASTDAWHYTNCWPVAARFAALAALWLGVERHLLGLTRANRVTVFAGVIQSPSDPTFGALAVPCRCWKLVVAVTPSGGLGALGFVVDQSGLLGVGGSAPTPTLRQTRATLGEIQQLAGITFPGLRDLASPVGTAPLLTSYQELAF